MSSYKSSRNIQKKEGVPDRKFMMTVDLGGGGGGGESLKPYVSRISHFVSRTGYWFKLNQSNVILKHL